MSYSCTYKICYKNVYIAGTRIIKPDNILPFSNLQNISHPFHILYTSPHHTHSIFLNQLAYFMYTLPYSYIITISKYLLWQFPFAYMIFPQKTLQLCACVSFDKKEYFIYMLHMFLYIKYQRVPRICAHTPSSLIVVNVLIQKFSTVFPPTCWIFPINFSVLFCIHKYAKLKLIYVQRNRIKFDYSYGQIDRHQMYVILKQL